MSEEQSHPAKAWFLWAKSSVVQSRYTLAGLVTLAAITGLIALYLSPDFTFFAQVPDRLTTSRGSEIASIFHDSDLEQSEFEGSKVDVFLLREHGQEYDEIVDESYEPLGSAVADSDGIAVVALPAIQRDWLKNPSAREVQLAVRSEFDGDARWTMTHVPLDDDPIVAVSTDRPLYQPGQTILMRFLTVDKDTGRPRTDQDVHLEVRDAKNNLIASEDLKTSPTGVAESELPLAKPCVQGQYTLTVRVGQTEETRNFNVRPFRLPRFKVQVETNQPSVAGGGTVTGRVQARYTYGDPVKSGEVSLNITSYANGRPMADTVKGVTDGAGNMAFAWTVPAETSAGSAVEFNATVSSAAGRTEQGTGQVSIAGGYSISLYPAYQPSFRASHKNDGYIVLVDSTGQGVANASITLTLPNDDGEREVALKTDALGRAKFVWDPGYQAREMTAAVALPNGESFTQNLSANLQTDHGRISYKAPVMRANETVSFDVESQPEASTLVLINHGMPVHHVLVPANASSVDIELPTAAIGLSRLVRRGPSMSGGERSIWVSQPGGDRIAMSAKSANYRPGEQASLKLSFDPQDSQVTFGAVGVDEALYALKERAEVPLPVLMRGIPPSLATAFSATVPDDEAGKAIYASKLQRALEAQAPVAQQTYTQDITAELHKVRRASVRKAWAVLLYLLLFGAVFWGGKTTWRSISKDAFSWRRTWALGGSIVVAGLYAISLGVMHGEVLMGGVFVWCTVVVAWVLGAAIRNDALPLDRWLGINLVVLAVALLLYATIEPLRNSVLQEFFPVIAAGVPLVTFGIESLLWVYVAYREREWSAAFGLATLSGVLILGPLGMAFSSIGTSFEPEMAKGGYRAESVMAPSPMVSKKSDMADRTAGRGPGGPPSTTLANIGTHKPARVRSWFPETMLWIPELAADAQGEATAKFELPDSITTWRVNAWAHTSDGRFGEGQFGLTVTQPVFVELDLPTHLTAGDQIDIPVTVVNNSEESVMLPLSVVASDHISPSKLPAGVTLTAGTRRVLWLRIRATSHGVGEVTVTAGNASNGDAVKRTVEIAPDGRAKTDAFSGMINKSWVQPLALSTAAIPNTARVDVEVYPSAISDALDGMESMLRTPQGCFEQTSSATYPNVMVLQTLLDVPPDKWPRGHHESAQEAWQTSHDSAKKLVKLGYQKMLTFQKNDGGFALYPKASSRSSEMLTAYGLMQLSEMRKVTFVDPATMLKAGTFLESKQNENGSWPVYADQVSGGQAGGNDIGQIRATSFITLGLLAADKERFSSAIDLALSRIEKRIDAAGSGDALALAANALAQGGRKDAARKAIGRLESSMVRDKDFGYWSSGSGTWMGSYGQYAQVETTAIAAYAMIASGAGAESLPLALNFLAQSRSGRGGWGTTQATVWALRTLGKLRDKQNPTQLQIHLDGEEMPRADGLPGAGTLAIGNSPQPLVKFSGVPTLRYSAVTIASTEETSAMAKAMISHYVRWSDPESSDPPQTPISVRVETPKNAAATVPTQTVLRLQNLTEDQLRTLIIEIPIAPGAFVGAEQFESWVESGAIDEFEILPTHVRLYVSQLGPKAALAFTMKWTPFLSGDVSLPPARAYRFYTPEPVAESRGGRTKIAERR